MIRDDLLEMKAEVFIKAFGFTERPRSYEVNEADPAFVPWPDTEAGTLVARGRREGSLDARDLIAVGLTVPEQNRSPAGNLVIFVQQQKLLNHPIVEQAIRIARGNARVVYTGAIRKLNRHARVRPLAIGSSIGHYRISAGTLGCFVRKRDGGGVGVLSNNHVLADSNRAEVGDLILQPGRADGGRAGEKEDHVAHLHHYVPIDFDPVASNEVDAAYALLLHGLPHISDRVGIPPSGWSVGDCDDLIGQESVKKLGRTTGLTEGQIAAINVDNVIVSYNSGPLKRVARFSGQISIEGLTTRFSAPGDSGSLIFTDQDRPVALLFSGSERGGKNGLGITFANSLAKVLDQLEVDLYNGG